MFLLFLYMHLEVLHECYQRWDEVFVPGIQVLEFVELIFGLI